MRRAWLFLFLIQTFNGFSQTGPGGIGSADGSSDLHLWLDASRGITGFAPVTGWEDQSGYGNDVSTIGGNPSIVNTLNGQNSIYLDGDDYFQGPVPDNSNSTATVYFAGVIDNSSSSDAGIISATGSSGTDSGFLGNAAFMMKNSSTDDLIGKRGGGNLSQGTDALLTPGTRIFGSNFSGLVHTMRVDGSANSTVLSIGNFDFDKMTIGKRDPVNTYSIGDYAEIIYFKSSLNDVEQIILENYLSAKYDANLASATDLYDRDDDGYDFDVAGIGKLSFISAHNDSQGTGIVRINDPSNLGDDEFLFWGHDNGDPFAGEVVDVPSGVVARLERVWAVSEVNSSGSAVDVGSVDVSFDLSDYGDITASDMRLLVDDDGVFSDADVISGAIDDGGGMYRFASVSQISNDEYFTLGTTNIGSTPLPVGIADFELKNIADSKIKIEWQTYTESNCHGFNIDRSSDGIHWEQLGFVVGAGNSKKTNRYVLFDSNPRQGMTFYYRLKQIDLIGSTINLKIKSIFLENPFNINVYPNPATDQFIIDSNLKNFKVEIKNELGQTIDIPFTELSGRRLYDIKAINAGIYMVILQTEGNLVFQKKVQVLKR